MRTVTKSPMTMVTTKIEPMAMPGLHSGTMTFHSICQPLAPASRAASISAAVDAHHRVEDRHHHEQRVEVHHGQHDGEVGEQQELERLLDQAELRSASS